MPAITTPPAERRKVLNPKNMRTVETTFTDTEAADYLSTHATTDEFASSLVSQYWALQPKNRQLSPVQIYWLHKKAMDIFQPTPAPLAQSIGDFTGIKTLFDKAAQNLRYPKVHLAAQGQTPHGGTLTLYVTLSRCGPLSRYTGQIAVKDNANNYFGRVDLDGKFHAKDGCPALIEPLLQHFAKNPAKIAAEYGKLTGQCSFCFRPLSDERSTAVGFGPVCAKKWGLAWG